MIRGIILDLDGTLYRGEEEVPGAGLFVRRMHELGIHCLYVTNRANRSVGEIAEHLRSFGIDCAEEDVLTSAAATALYLKEGSAYVVGEPPLVDALRAQGLRITDKDADYVVVGFDRTLTYEKLKTACRLIDAGAQFVATNPDPYLKVENGRQPGTGSIVAAVATGSGQQPLVIGKPEKTIVEMSLRLLDMPASDVLMVGDNMDTDIAAGVRCGLPTALILTGVSTREEGMSAGNPPTWIVDDFEQLEARIREDRALIERLCSRPEP